MTSSQMTFSQRQRKLPTKKISVTMVAATKNLSGTTPIIPDMHWKSVGSLGSLPRSKLGRANVKARPSTTSRGLPRVKVPIDDNSYVLLCCVILCPLSRKRVCLHHRTKIRKRREQNAGI